jgi:hypothetical protein
MSLVCLKVPPAEAAAIGAGHIEPVVAVAPPPRDLDGCLVHKEFIGWTTAALESKVIQMTH